MEKGTKTRDEDKDKKRQKAIEKLHYKFIRINPDKEGFDMYVEFGKIYNHIIESAKKNFDRQDSKSNCC